MLTTRSFLLLLDEVGGGGWGRGRPHVSDHSDAVLGQGGQPQPLPPPDLDGLQLLEPPQRELKENRGGRVSRPGHCLRLPPGGSAGRAKKPPPNHRKILDPIPG